MSMKRRLTALVNSSNAALFASCVACVLTASVSVADPHDEVVYKQNSRKLKPNSLHYKYDMKFTELDHPAARADVDKGSALFTFEGLGPTRVWKLPKCPVSGHWVALRDYPLDVWQRDGVTTTNQDNFGCICQAEELQINGRWMR